MRRVLVVILAGTLVLAGCTTPVTTDGPQSPDGELEIHHIDVGQADATLLIGPEGETILIDTGDYRADGEEVLAYLDEQGVERIDHLVTTHPHADHIGGHEAVIDTYETERDGIGAIYDPGATTTTNTYDEYLDAVERHDVELFEVKRGDMLPTEGPIEAEVLHPGSSKPENLNDDSIALSISFGETTYLTTGDVESGVESTLVEEYGDELEADIYQAGHHGSSTSSTEEFLSTVDPSVSVISSAGDSRFGHPHDETLERFAEHGIETYWTGAHGNVVVTTDGQRVSVQTERDRPTDAEELLELKPIKDTTEQIAVAPSAPRP
ncbi:ComEC/Rec2 family competence protein [Halovenus halobia]|uniref:ComEC/Rec2 family competence protein n=1 Tax=Halovenus halobia TaxID=3396622 RepID=UPI003F57DFF3